MPGKSDSKNLKKICYKMGLTLIKQVDLLSSGMQLSFIILMLTYGSSYLLNSSGYVLIDSKLKGFLLFYGALAFALIASVGLMLYEHFKYGDIKQGHKTLSEHFKQAFPDHYTYQYKVDEDEYDWGHKKLPKIDAQLRKLFPRPSGFESALFYSVEFCCIFTSIFYIAKMFERFSDYLPSMITWAVTHGLLATLIIFVVVVNLLYALSMVQFNIHVRKVDLQLLNPLYTNEAIKKALHSDDELIQKILGKIKANQDRLSKNGEPKIFYLCQSTDIKKEVNQLISASLFFWISSVTAIIAFNVLLVLGLIYLTGLNTLPIVLISVSSGLLSCLGLCFIFRWDRLCRNEIDQSCSDTQNFKYDFERAVKQHIVFKAQSDKSVFEWSEDPVQDKLEKKVSEAFGPLLFEKHRLQNLHQYDPIRTSWERCKALFLFVFNASTSLFSITLMIDIVLGYLLPVSHSWWVVLTEVLIALPFALAYARALYIFEDKHDLKMSKIVVPLMQRYVNEKPGQGLAVRSEDINLLPFPPSPKVKWGKQAIEEEENNSNISNIEMAPIKKSNVKGPGFFSDPLKTSIGPPLSPLPTF